MKIFWIFAGLIACWASPALSAEYRTLARPAILYDAPSIDATKIAIGGRDLPLEVFIETATWVKARTHTGRLLWIESTALNGKPGVMVSVDEASIRQNPQEDADVSFRATRGVFLEYLGEAQSGWIKVRHVEGLVGWIHQSEVWGN